LAERVIRKKKKLLKLALQELLFFEKMN